MESFQKIKFSAFSGLQEVGQVRLFTFHVTKQNCT